MEQDMDEEVEVDTGGLGALGAMGGIDFGRLRTDPAAVLGDVYKQQMAAQEAEKKSLAEFYEKGRANIIARNRGPSTSEQLFALSRALLAPRKYRGIASTIDKISGAFGDISSAQRRAEMSREEQLAKFDEAYGMKRAALGTQSAKMAGDLVRTAGQYIKKPTQNWSENMMSYVSPDEPKPTRQTVTTKSGITLRQYTDGSLRFTNPDGSQDVYDPATGMKIGTVPSKGAM
jgi:hypothetical protein